MEIEIQSVGVSYTKTDKGGYSTAEVKYIDQETGREKSKKIMSFSNPKVFDTLKEAVSGNIFTITEKQVGDFKNWVAIESRSTETVQKAATVASKPVATTSQYETRDERNARQRLIVRQSSLSNAVSILSAGAKSPLDVAAVKTLANELTAFVYEAPGLTDMIDDLPY